jgi:hypothetical protein
MKDHRVHHYYTMFAATAELTMATTFHILHNLHISSALPIGFGAFALYATVTLAYLRRNVVEARKL